MTLQQLRYLVEIAQRGFNVSEAAEALFTSQPGVSKQIKQLENDLGVIIFERIGKRLTGVTEAGAQVLIHARRILAEADNLKRYVDDYTQGQHGALVIATTHTQARYALPEVIRHFRAEYPKVHLTLHQGSPREIAELLTAGEADIAIATEWLANVPEVVTFPYYTWHHAVIVPKGHPLTKLETITLAHLAEYPVVTYHEGFTGRTNIDRCFSEAGQAPDVVLSAIDADVIKTYVGIGLGIGIVAAMAFDPERDGNLELIDCTNLFVPNTTRLALRRGVYLRRYVHAFIEQLVPGLSEARISEALKQESITGEDFSI